MYEDKKNMFDFEKLVDLRNDAGLTQEEFACKIGCSSRSVVRWESGECIPQIYYINIIGELFNINPCEFFVKDNRWIR